jgi:hypothetical protein
MPGSSRSLLQTSSSFANWAASRLESSSEKNAHEYVSESSRNSLKKSFETS